MRVIKNLLFMVILICLCSSTVFAQAVEDVAQNITDSAVRLPGLVSALAYLTGLILIVSAVNKTIAHVSNPTQTPLRSPVGRAFVGGALFALPIVYEAAYNTISGGAVAAGVENDSAMSTIFGAAGLGSFVLAPFSVNTVLLLIDTSMNQVPGFISVVAYMLGMVIGVSGVLKIKEHIEEPEKTTIREPFIRLLTTGALFALPTLYDSLYNTVVGTGGVLELAEVAISGTLIGLMNISDFAGLYNNCAMYALLPTLVDTLGANICTAMVTTSYIPQFISGLSLLIGLVFGVWGVLKIRDHVLSPQQTKVSEGVMRLIAAGLFFSLPVIAIVINQSMTTVALTPTISGAYAGSAPTCTTTNGLDEAMFCFMQNIIGPTQIFLDYFSLIAGLIFIMIGVSRLIKSAQEGPRGPGGRGTIATFVIGGILISGTKILYALTGSMFGNSTTLVTANLAYTTGMTVLETNAAYNVISGILQFMIIVGLISFIRGLFIVREVAEGSQQASLMAAMTHIIGGALAVNIGPLMNAIQETLGITAFGVTFS